MILDFLRILAQIIHGVAKTRVRVTPRVRVRVEGEGKGKGKGKDEGKGGGENCCGNSNLDFHPKFLPPKIVFFILYISLNSALLKRG